MDFAASLGLTMFHDHGGLSGLQPYQYALNLWREKKLKVRVRPWFWSGDDDGVSVAETRISNDYDVVGDDVWRQLGVGEPINPSTTSGRLRRSSAATFSIFRSAFCSAKSRTLHVLSKITSAVASPRARV